MIEANTGRLPWWKNQLVYEICCCGIVITLLFWPLLNSIFCLGLFAWWLFFSKKSFSLHTTRSRLVILFSLLYLLVIIGTFYSADRGEALFKLQLKPTYLIFPLVFGTTSIVTKKLLRLTLRTLILSTVAGAVTCMLYGVYQYMALHNPSYLTGYPMVILKNMHPVVMGLCALLSIICLMESTIGDRHDRLISRPWSFVFVALLVVFLFLVGNRSNLIFLAGMMLYYGFRLIPAWRHRFIFLSSLAVLFILSILFIPSVRRQWNDLVDFSKENSIQLDSNQPAEERWGGKTLRLAIWTCAMDVVKANWLTGVGTGDAMASLEEAYRKREFHSAAGHKEYNAHNQYIQEIISYGITGGLVLIACIVIPLILPLRIQMHTAYTLFLLAFAFTCLTECLLELNKGIIWYSFFNALFVFSEPSGRKEEL